MCVEDFISVKYYFFNEATLKIFFQISVLPTDI